ncbi:hypothetical protein [Ruminococcus sp. HUN007]|uniref:hypothetical protein n=1 Tax=Ruminococcus sp. HUN007 TaxID=1514668 RepID=UPI0005D2D0A1|nr:hypothetical protein [Ruminococcus sp. HUN007]
MTYTFWKILFISSGALTVLLIVLTIIFIIRFRFFELVHFLIHNKNENFTPAVHSQSVSPKRAERPAVTEKLSDRRTENYSGITPDGTVIACRPADTAAPDRFVITRNTIIINADPSVLDQI